MSSKILNCLIVIFLLHANYLSFELQALDVCMDVATFHYATTSLDLVPLTYQETYVEGEPNSDGVVTAPLFPF